MEQPHQEHEAAAKEEPKGEGYGSGLRFLRFYGSRSRGGESAKKSHVRGRGCEGGGMATLGPKDPAPSRGFDGSV